jgi:homoserine kinase type II
MSDFAPLAALQVFSGCCGQFQLQQLERVGFSGSTIWKVSAADGFLLHEFPGPLCLKRWPADHPPPARLPWIHRVLKQARDRGIDFVPEMIRTQQGATICEAAGSTWELMTWLPGSVETERPATERRMAAALRALAKFHQAVRGRESLAVEDSSIQEIAHRQRFPTRGPAPAFADRFNRWQELRAGKIEAIRTAVERHRIELIDDLAQRWIANHSALSCEMANNLSIAAQLPLPLQPAIRDLWRDHVLFDGSEVTGFIDFGAMRIDTPLTDLARLIGSLAGDEEKLRSAAFAAYAALQPLTPREVELIDLLDHSGTLIAGWNWLDWLYVEQRQFPSLAAVRERLSELLRLKK